MGIINLPHRVIVRLKLDSIIFCHPYKRIICSRPLPIDLQCCPKGGLLSNPLTWGWARLFALSNGMQATLLASMDFKSHWWFCCTFSPPWGPGEQCVPYRGWSFFLGPRMKMPWTELQSPQTEYKSSVGKKPLSGFACYSSITREKADWYIVPVTKPGFCKPL